MHVFGLVAFFQIVSILGFALTALKLLTTGLYRRYRFFLSYVLFGVPYMAASLFVNRDSRLYMRLFTTFEPVAILLPVLVVFEVYRLVLARYKALYTTGIVAMLVAVTISAGTSAASFVVALAHTTHSPLVNAMVRLELQAEAQLDLGLILFILLLHLFLSLYPIVLSRNVLLHTVVYSIYFLSNAVGLVLWQLDISPTETVSTTLVGISAACSLVWALGLSSRGEEKPVHWPVLRSGSEARLLAQLDAINASLSSAARTRLL